MPDRTPASTLNTGIPAGPALGVLELCAVSRGLLALDAAVKKAPVHVVEAAAIMPGKYLLRLNGGVDEVAEALDAARRVAGDTVVDHVLLPFPHDQLVETLAGPRTPSIDGLAVVETYSIAAAIRAADAALKATAVEALRLDRGMVLGGKAAFYFTGPLHDLEAAIERALSAAGPGLLVGHEIIPNPHPQTHA
ncbi:MAG: BMC domain-containing protein [Myxococcales bacterium]|nr:BMC domain-containing protein [Myxococcales bacterium]MCB9523719.1 BMC domain-containing protein [Myxococcales bacterium]